MAKPKEVPPEIRIELDWSGRVDHARAMFHMEVAEAEARLDQRLETADTIRDSELAKVRHDRHHKAEVCTCP